MGPTLRRSALSAVESLTSWVGSVYSLILHTIVFAAFFAVSFTGLLAWDLMFLILTTIVSLEAIYLAIFIQITVNEHTRSLREVEQDIDEIEEDIDEIQEDVEEMSEDDSKDAERRKLQSVTLESLTTDVRKMLADLEHLKNGR